MSARDLAAETLRDNERAELEALRDLRDGMLAMGALLQKSARHEPITETERAALALFFDSDGMGPFITIEPGALRVMVNVARKAKSLEVPR